MFKDMDFSDSFWLMPFCTMSFDKVLFLILAYNFNSFINFNVTVSCDFLFVNVIVLYLLIFLELNDISRILNRSFSNSAGNLLVLYGAWVSYKNISRLKIWWFLMKGLLVSTVFNHLSSCVTGSLLYTKQYLFQCYITVSFFWIYYR